MKRFWFLLVAIMILSLGLIAAGCPADDAADEDTAGETEEHGDDHDDGDEDADEHGDDHDDGDASDASISITTPADGDEVAGPDVEVTVEVEGFEMVNKPGEEAIEGEGHLHWNVDGGADTPTFTTEFTIPGLAAGEHTIQTKLHNNDHTPVDGPESSEVTITVTE